MFDYKVYANRGWVLTGAPSGVLHSMGPACQEGTLSSLPFDLLGLELVFGRLHRYRHKFTPVWVGKVSSFTDFVD